MPSTASISPPPDLAQRLTLFARDIKVSHTLFAMPWALLATFLSANGHPKIGQLLLIVLCMVTARTVAMASNRLLDAELDARNPRTAIRAIPSGRLSRGFYWMISGICAIAFIASTSLFYFVYSNPLPLLLSIPVLLFVAAYPLLKRFSRLCHYYLGAALALAPICAWIAITGTISLDPLIMAAAVLLWTAGFDIIYACQDYHSDLEIGVVSVPVKFGIPGALWIARFTHAICYACMIALGLHSAPLSTLYFAGVACAGVLLIIEHSLVKPHDLSKVGLAFFTINGIISLLIGVLGIVDVYV
jgi:4-hydroxybenzoate polyprenyltransferase